MTLPIWKINTRRFSHPFSMLEKPCTPLPPSMNDSGKGAATTLRLCLYNKPTKTKKSPAASEKC